MTDNNDGIITEWIEVKVPQHCDICGEKSRKLRLIGGAKKREWLCPACIKEAEQLLLNSDEFLQIRLEQKKRKDAKKMDAQRDSMKREAGDLIIDVAAERRKKGIL